MVTFELFARLAIELLAGETEPVLRFSNAALKTPFRHKTGLTRFLPASLSSDGAFVTPVRWQGSGDVFAVSRANAFLVAEQDRESWETGDFMRVLPR
jgi:molybdopterin molybdotransferase